MKNKRLQLGLIIIISGLICISCKSIRGNALGNKRDNTSLSILQYEEFEGEEKLSSESTNEFEDGLNKIKQGGGAQ